MVDKCERISGVEHQDCGSESTNMNKKIVEEYGAIFIHSAV
jgi:hypothetical protein